MTVGRIGKWTMAASVLLGLGALGSGCLARPVSRQEPTTKANFANSIKAQPVDKIDLLFAIDNSASMADKQDILAKAVPDLVTQLLNPACVDEKGNPNGERANPTAEEGKECATGKPEFPPVTDLHIGVVTSSLGAYGADTCGDAAPTNDGGMLINRKRGTNDPVVAAVQPSNYLSWFPPTIKNQGKTAPVNPYADQAKLGTDFAEFVKGANETGCGLEGQLESVYRFLIQPDPYGRVEVDAGGKASFKDVNVQLLQQRKAFLRPDSLVAIIMLTDEDDSTVDPVSFQGKGWLFMGKGWGSDTSRGAPRATSTCAKLSNDPKARGNLDPNTGAPSCRPQDPGCCTSCGFNATPNDPECQKNGGYYTPIEDRLDVRFQRMRERYGVDPQYPVSRYIDGFTKPRVPDRENEHDGTGNYTGGDLKKKNCVNPLFAKELPDGSDLSRSALCDLPLSTFRDKNLVFFAIVGGVPNDVLRDDQDYQSSGVLSSTGWTKLIGRDPANFDFSGRDARMEQSLFPRAGRPDPSAPDVSGDESDPAKENYNTSHRDWDTTSPNGGGNDDLQYACTFPLPDTAQRDCTASAANCDCGANKLSPLCQPGTNPTTNRRQVRAKAYPTVRQLRVAKGLDKQGIVASICPIVIADSAINSPLYGYRPAVQKIVDRLKEQLQQQCLPQPLTPDPGTQLVSCLVLELTADQNQGCNYPGRSKPDLEIEEKFRAVIRARQGAVADAKGAVDLSKNPICKIDQVKADPGTTCVENDKPGWCYVVARGDQRPAGKCESAIAFTRQYAPRPGAEVSLQCIQVSGAGTGGDGGI